MSDDAAGNSGRSVPGGADDTDVATLLDGVRSGERAALARAITLIESTNEADRSTAIELIDRSIPFAGNSIRIGISGLPGAGKSTFIDRLGCFIADEGHRVAVLTIDPSSERSGGSILADKTRMQNLVRRENVFVRPSASRGSLGGVGLRTRESIVLCEAAGYDVVIVETIGVGQSEAEVRRLVDIVILMVTTGGGDELQSIKRGVIEFADMILVSKADGDNVERARETATMYRNAVHLLHDRPGERDPFVRAVSAHNAADVLAVWDTVKEYTALARESGYLEENRRMQASDWLRSAIREVIEARLFHAESTSRLIRDHQDQVREGSESPSAAAVRIVDEILAGRSNR
ncbi:MAG: methylmalonyl Co-A mutase-associated GTPase MeaB [Rhodothermia bacterium]|nr:methylmalonyl Co-A mutase-associated GTPase MeaB [Rhodothermia bacterium]